MNFLGCNEYHCNNIVCAPDFCGMANMGMNLALAGTTIAIAAGILYNRNAPAQAPAALPAQQNEQAGPAAAARRAHIAQANPNHDKLCRNGICILGATLATVGVATIGFTAWFFESFVGAMRMR